MRRPALIPLVVAALAAFAALPGCGKQQKSVVITDDSPARRAEAYRLAADAQRAVQRGDTAKGIALYQQALESSRDLFFVWNNLGLLYMDRQDYADAAEMFKQASELAPADPRPDYNIGLIYQRVVYDEQAIEYFKRSLARSNRFVPALRGYALSAKRLDRADDETLEKIRTALMVENDPQWRRIFETEVLRIEGSMAAARASRAPRAVRPGAPRTPAEPATSTPAAQQPVIERLPAPVTLPAPIETPPPATPEPAPRPSEPAPAPSEPPAAPPSTLPGGPSPD